MTRLCLLLVLLIACGGAAQDESSDAARGGAGPSTADVHGWCCQLPDGTEQCGYVALGGADFSTFDFGTCTCNGIVRGDECLDTAEQ